MENSKKTFFTEWLEKLQQESWQLELLISGFAIFGLFQARPALFSFLNTLTDSVTLSTFPLIIISYALFYGWYVFIINLIIHVVVRGLWIGAIGLRYVSGDIDYAALNYSPPFSNYFRKKTGSFDNYIEELERLASVLFAYTFLLLFMILSFLFFLSFLFGVLILFSYFFKGTDLSSENISINIQNRFFSISFFVFLFLGLFVLFDFISLGLLKKIKQRHFAKFYFFIFRLFSLLTLSFLWRPLLLNFLDTKYTKRLFLLSIPYCFLIAFILPSLEILKDEYYPTFEEGGYEFSSIVHEQSFHFQFYDDERRKVFGVGEPQRVRFMSIPSKRVSGNFLELFIKAHHDDKLLIKSRNPEIFPLSKRGIISSDFSDRQFENEAFVRDSTTEENEREDEKVFKENILGIKRILTDALKIKIDDSEIPNDLISFDFYLHPDALCKGILAFVPIDSLPPGRHYISVNKKRGIAVDEQGLRLDSIVVKIPFILD